MQWPLVVLLCIHFAELVNRKTVLQLSIFSPHLMLPSSLAFVCSLMVAVLTLTSMQYLILIKS